MLLFAADAEEGGLPFPSLSNLIEWTPLIGDPDSPLALDKIGITHIMGALIPALVFFIAAQQNSLVPTGIRGIVESVIEFVETQIILPAIGPDGLRYLPLLLSFFVFISLGNLFEVIPFFQMPLNARMGPPLVFALISWVMFISVGIKHHGGGYIKEVLFPPGVPKALYILITPIELLSTFIVRPFSHAVRLFANMLAGHILLITFGVLSIATFEASALIVPWLGAFAGLIAFTAFEIGVSFIQGFVFAILAAVYIGGALHPSH